ncbi:MAG: carboxymuconolactone decarboxylase family protein [Candidatus Lambdaproteobacteria bacterium]|nr:carboxymuconolactone decarboxylase family protein [Candidatus Lambdaproteobacteria bacterium]
MPRVPEVTPENANPEQHRIIAAITGGPRGGLRGPFKVMLHSPKLADGVQALGGFLRFGTSLQPRISELAIIITGRFLGARVEWVGHSVLARKGGLPEDVIQAVLERRRPVFTHADEEACYDLVTELHHNHQVSDATFQQAVQHFGIAGTCELVGVTGYYSMVGLFLKAFQIEPPADVPMPFLD